MTMIGNLRDIAKTSNLKLKNFRICEINSFDLWLGVSFNKGPRQKGKENCRSDQPWLGSSRKLYSGTAAELISLKQKTTEGSNFLKPICSTISQRSKAF